MEMKIKSALVRAEREKRAWSQQHLATATGLGLRTVQRIEASGTASYESLLAIASCLEIDVSRLRLEDNSKSFFGAANRLRRSTVSATLAVFAVVIAALSMQGALAEQVLLDLGVTKKQDNDTRELATQILLEDGKPYELTMDNAFKFEISAAVQSNKQILIAVKLFDYRNDEFVLVAEPKVLTVGGKEAEIQLGRDEGKTGFFNILVTPHIQ